MQFKAWMSAHNYTWARQPRGFQFENHLGEARFVQLIDGPRITRFITELDVYVWINGEILRQATLFTSNSRAAWKTVERPNV